MLIFGAGSADGDVLSALYAHGDPLVTAIASSLTVLGDAPVLIMIAAAGAAMALLRGQPGLGWTVIAVALIGRALVSAQKYGVARVRPDQHDHLAIVSNPSFPSGHAANSVITYVTIALVLSAGTRWTRPAVAVAIALAVLIGSSRVVLGVHWPSDVLGGWAFGALWLMVALPVAERLIPRR